MNIVIANKSHTVYVTIISETIANAASDRGTGIAKRTPEYITAKIIAGNAVIALQGDVFAGFCYIEAWSHGKFVANSGLIVHPEFRGIGLAKKIKRRIFEHSRAKFPNSKIFSITTGLAVMKMNYELGYQPVTFSELTNDDSFWKGCQTCKNYDVLIRTSRKMCLCTGMLYDTSEKKSAKHSYNIKVLRRLKNIKQLLFLKKNNR
ncbi:GNAT family N-acetyltransferase [Tenacibaculum maritimum]|uniref:GNAT family N-acetyltransferase n=1 Tax=Tenacibaculum maritimum TaxID=107401 RepID=UPI0012E4EED9|nr:GNAT family N-acetyltransferase [Tenacibaculum maritimum]CAA0174029.1 probable amino-acid acetyltransferase [Tenacibaculum maritimum]CAA0199154.1 probable amino-acid acetyltransferase [Tenacibaculum maritimum]